VFAAGAVVAAVGIFGAMTNALPPRGPVILFCLGGGVALTALGIQVLLNQIAIRRTRSNAILSLLFLPHLLVVPVVGIGLIVAGIGMLIGYAGF
jgi:hypothetical protein